MWMGIATKIKEQTWKNNRIIWKYRKDRFFFENIGIDCILVDEIKMTNLKLLFTILEMEKVKLNSLKIMNWGMGQSLKEAKESIENIEDIEENLIEESKMRNLKMLKM